MQKQLKMLHFFLFFFDFSLIVAITICFIYDDWGVDTHGKSNFLPSELKADKLRNAWLPTMKVNVQYSLIATSMAVAIPPKSRKLSPYLTNIVIIQCKKHKKMT